MTTGTPYPVPWAAGGRQLHAAINAAAAGANVLLSGVLLKRFLVLAYVLVNNGTLGGTFLFESEGGLALTGGMGFSDYGGAAPPFNPIGQFAPTVAGEDLVLFLAGGAIAKGYMSYILID